LLEVGTGRAKVEKEKVIRAQLPLVLSALTVSDSQGGDGE
jgi:hypothetical protein